MAKYLLLVHGKKVRVRWHGEVRQMGFYKSVKVDIDKLENLFEAALAQMKQDQIFMSVIAYPDELNTHCEINEYSPWRFRLRTGFLKGAAFFDEPD